MAVHRKKDATKGAPVVTGATIKKSYAGSVVSGVYRVVHGGYVSGVFVFNEIPSPVSHTTAPMRSDPTLLDPYDWGPQGIPEGKPVRYVRGKGFDFGDF